MSMSLYLFPAALNLPGGFDQREVAQGIIEIHQGKFQLAEKRFGAIRDKYPERPEGYMLLSLYYSIYMNYYKTFKYRDKFYSAAEEAVDLSRQFIQSAPAEEIPFYRFYLGGTIGYLGIQKLREGSILSSFKDGLEGVRIFRKVLEENTNIIDAYFGLSQFHYYKYYYKNKLSFIPLGKNDKELAYTYMNLVIREGYFLSVEALLSLFSIRIYENELDNIEQDIITKYRQYPGNIFFCYKLLDLYEKTGESEKSLQVLDDVLAHLNRNPDSGPAAYILVLYQGAKAAYSGGFTAKALRFLEIQQTYRSSIEGCFDDKENIEKGSELLKKIRKEIN